MRFKDPQKVHGVRRPRRRPSPTSSCRSASAATWRCSRAGPAAARGRGRRTGHGPRPRVHRAALRRVRRVRASDPGRRPRRPSSRPPGFDREQLQRVAQMLIASQRTIVLLGDGTDPAPPRGGHHRRGHQPAADARHDRQARRRGVPGARALQRAGRPHDGHLGEDARSVPGRAGRASSASPARASTATTRSTRSAPCATARAKVFIGMGGNFVSATPDTEVTEAALRGCALTVQISTKLNRSHVVHGRTALILPTLGRTDRDIQAGGKQLVTVEDSMSMVHLSRGSLHPPSDQLRSEVAIVCRLARARARPGASGAVGAIRRRLRPHPRRASPASCPASPTTTPGSASPTASSCPTRRGTPASSPPPPARPTSSVDPLEWVPVPAGRLLLQTLRSHDQYNTTIYGLDDRYRGVKGGRRVVFVNPADIDGARACRRRPRRPGVRVPGADGTVQERRAKDFLVVPYSTPGRQCRGLLPGDQPAGAAGPHRGQVEHPGVEGRRDPAGAAWRWRARVDRRRRAGIAPDRLRRRVRRSPSAPRPSSSRNRWRSGSTARR